MVAKQAGSFLGGFFNNPGLVAIALGIGALLVFRKPIQEAFASFGENFGKLPSITLTEIKLPDFNFPEIKLPDFGFPKIGDLDPVADVGEEVARVDQNIQGGFDKLIDLFNKPTKLSLRDSSLAIFLGLPPLLISKRTRSVISIPIILKYSLILI